MKTVIKTLIVLIALAVHVQPLTADDMSPSSGSTALGLPELKVKGKFLVANGQPLRLRGLDWGWWHLNGTRYSEIDMQHVAGWGANVIRLAFSYTDLETTDNPPVMKEEGFKDLDEVVQWGKKYGVYVILDMHVVPGGQGTLPYTDGGRNLLWKDPAEQQHFVDLWTEIAKRYAHRPEIAAYDLMNEPDSTQNDPSKIVDIYQRVISAIRAEDPDKILVVGGDRGTLANGLSDPIKLSDNNLLYTFHFYEGSGHFHDDWVSTDEGKTILSGTKDWTKVDETFTAPANADQMTILPRSDNNSGTAWFDDVRIEDSSGKVLQTASFDQDAEDYRPEREPLNEMTFDQSTGHDKGGSLKVQGTTAYNGWFGQYVPVQPGESVHVSAWVKLDHATGRTYLGAAFFHNKTAINREAFEQKMAPAVAFANKFQVPVWVGEFGCEASDKDYQSEWTKTCISLFEEHGFNWTYWNDKETSDPIGMGLQPENADASDRPVNQSLLAVLQQGWTLNKSPESAGASAFSP